MLTIADFSRKIIFDLNKTFPIARVQGKYVIVESNPNSVSVPISSIYGQLRISVTSGHPFREHPDSITE